MSIGERIKDLRGDMTQAEFSVLTKVPKNTLGRYERDEIVPGGEAIALLCKNLNIDPNWLLFGEGPVRRNEEAQPPQLQPSTDGLCLSQASCVDEGFRERLKTLRGMKTRREFASWLGIHVNTLGNYERGERIPDMDFIAKTCRTMGVSTHWLVYGEGPMTSDSSKESSSQNDEVCYADVEFKMSDMLTKTAEVLESKTIYRTALASNINAFHQAVNSERTLARIEERMALLEKKMDDLIRENNELRQRLEMSSNQSKTVGADG